MSEQLTPDEREKIRQEMETNQPVGAAWLGWKEVMERLLDDLERVERELGILRADPYAHQCLEAHYKAERDQARKDLDGKDHECASLKADLERTERERDEANGELRLLRDTYQRVAELKCVAERERDEARAELQRANAWPRCEECAAELVDSGYPEGKSCPVCDLRDRLRDAELGLAQKAQEMTRLYDEINRGTRPNQLYRRASRSGD